MSSLRIGVLGAARISKNAIVDPAAAEGHRLVAVAASSRGRAERFAAEHGVERVLDSYQALVDDPDIDVIYNPLVNSLHAEWDSRAAQAGKHVLGEKPLTANAFEARQLRDAVAAAPGSVVEAFHYLHHPSVQQIGKIIRSGVLGEITSAEATFTEPPPAPDDPRWSYELAGGALMDIGCYALHIHRQLAAWLGAPEPTVLSAVARPRAGRPLVDEEMTVQLEYLPTGAPAVARCHMNLHRRMEFVVTGSRGWVRHNAFVLPQLDNRVFLSVEGHESVEALGDATSYTYQLRALADSLSGGPAFPLDLDDAVASMELIDAAYLAAGLPLRGFPSGVSSPA